MAWTDEQKTRLIELWNAGESAALVADQIGQSRNAVIGMVHRLRAKGIEMRMSEPARKRSMTARRKRALPVVTHTVELPPASAATRPVVVENRETEEPVSGPAVEATGSEHLPETAVYLAGAPAAILSLKPRDCKWPMGDPRDPDFHFCGEPRKIGAPYCKKHCTEAFHKPAKRTETADQKMARLQAAQRAKTRNAQIRALGGG